MEKVRKEGIAGAHADRHVRDQSVDLAGDQQLHAVIAPMIFEQYVAHQASLRAEPPIAKGTPYRYVPAGR